MNPSSDTAYRSVKSKQLRIFSSVNTASVSPKCSIFPSFSNNTCLE